MTKLNLDRAQVERALFCLSHRETASIWLYKNGLKYALGEYPGDLYTFLYDIQINNDLETPVIDGFTIKLPKKKLREFLVFVL